MNPLTFVLRRIAGLGIVMVRSQAGLLLNRAKGIFGREKRGTLPPK